MEPVHILLRSLVRSLYSTEHVIILELLINREHLTAKQISNSLPLPQAEISIMCDDLLSKNLISSLVQESTGKPCYYIDPKSAVDSVRRRLKAMRKNVDSYKKPTETETMKCGHCETALSYEDLQYPTGTGGFVCPGCNMELELIPLPTSSEAGQGNTVRDDLNYFFSLLMEADKACKAETENEKSRF